MKVLNYHGGDIYQIDKEIIDFSTNINPLGVPESFDMALAKRIKEFTKYTDIQYESVKKAVGEYLEVKAETIIPGNGAVDLIYKIARGCGCHRAVIAAPTFSEYERGLQVAGIEVKQVLCYDFETQNLNLEKLKQEVSSGCLVVICNPNNPTGSLLEKNVLIDFCVYLQKKKALLMIDEAFLDFVKEEVQISMAKEAENYSNLMVIRAATKFFGMPGLRLGYGVFGNLKIRERIEMLSEPWCLNTAAVIGAEVLLKDKKYIEKSKKWLSIEGPWLYQSLSEIDGLQVFSSKANFHLLKLKEKNQEGKILFEKMLQKGFLIRQWKGFFGLDDTYFRLAVRNREENQSMVKALKEALEEMKND